MGNHQDCCSILTDFLHAAVTFRLEEYVTDGKRLIDDQDLRLHIDGQRKRQSHKHTAGVSLDRLMHEISDIREIQDVLKLLVHLLFRKAHHGTIHVDILNSGIVHVEARTQFQQRRYLSVHIHFACGRCQDTGDDL